MHQGHSSAPALRFGVAALLAVAAGLPLGCQAFVTRADRPIAARPAAAVAQAAWPDQRSDSAVRTVGAEDEANDPLFARRLRRANLLAAQDDELKKAPAKSGAAAPPLVAPTPAPTPLPKVAPPPVPAIEAPKAKPDDLKGTRPGANATPMPPPVAPVPLEKPQPKAPTAEPPKPPVNSAAPSAPDAPASAPNLHFAAPMPVAAPPIVEAAGASPPAPVAFGAAPMACGPTFGAPLPFRRGVFAARADDCAQGACPAPTPAATLGMPVACTKGVSADQPGIADNFAGRLGWTGSFPNGGPETSAGLGILEASKQLGGRPWFGYAGLAAELRDTDHMPLSVSAGFSKLARLQGCCVVDPWIVALNYDGYFDSRFQGRPDSAYLDQVRGLWGYALAPGLDAGVWGAVHLREATYQNIASTRLAAATRYTTTRITDRLANRAAGYVSMDLNNRGAQVIASAGWQESPGKFFAELDGFLPVARNVNLWAGVGYGSNKDYDAAGGIELLYGQATLQARGRRADACGDPCANPCEERYRGGWANGVTRSALRVQTPARMRRSLATPRVVADVLDIADPLPPGPQVEEPFPCPPRLGGHTTRPRNPKLGPAAECEDAIGATTAASEGATQGSSSWYGASDGTGGGARAAANYAAWVQANAK